ncbi:MAG: hypothetical protein ACRCWS_05010 [Propionibacteriaceae bacterium]
MTQNETARKLDRLRALVAEAKAVPMSASCMLNRQETLALIDDVVASFPKEFDEAQEIIQQSKHEVLRGRDEGDQIRIEAEEWANKMASQTEIVARAEKQATKIMTDAHDEAWALRKETDQFVDTRMAEFEASLHKVQSQLRIMRSRLADRSSLDASDTQPLPKI